MYIYSCAFCAKIIIIIGTNLQGVCLIFIESGAQKVMFVLRIKQNNVKYRRFITETRHIVCTYKIKSLFL